MASPFLTQPGIERRRDLLVEEFNLPKQLHTDVWDDIAKKHNKHTSSVNSNDILSCNCKIFREEYKNKTLRMVKHKLEQENQREILRDILVM